MERKLWNVLCCVSCVTGGGMCGVGSCVWFDVIQVAVVVGSAGATGTAGGLGGAFGLT